MALLTTSNLSYLGTIRMPDNNTPGGSGTRFGYSVGSLTGRRVNGELRLFITGASGQAGGGDMNGVGDALYELRPNAFGAQATLVRNWGDVCQGRQLRADLNQGYEVRGLAYVDGKMWWAYGSQYFTGSLPDPSIGCSVLNDSNGAITAYGPWRTVEFSQKTRGYMLEIPTSYTWAGGRRIAVGAPTTSGNSQGPRGTCLTALDTFDPTTRPPNTASDYSGPKVDGRRLVYHDHTHPQVRNLGYILCQFNIPNDPSGGGFICPDDPTYNNNTPGGDLALDVIAGATWVKTSTVEGIVCVGQITDTIAGFPYASDGKPHMWYGPANIPCAHGHNGNPSVGTGPQSPTQVGMFHIYDPAALATATNPWDTPPSTSVRLSTLGITSSVITDRQYSGTWFDSYDNRLYIVDRFSDVIGNELAPTIHVFQVSGGAAPPAPTSDGGILIQHA